MSAGRLLRLLKRLRRNFLRWFLTIIIQVSCFNLLILFILITTFICFGRALLLYHILKGFRFRLISAGLALISAAWCSSTSLFVFLRLIFFILFPNWWINLLYNNTSAVFISKIVLFELTLKFYIITSAKYILGGFFDVLLKDFCFSLLLFSAFLVDSLEDGVTSLLELLLIEDLRLAFVWRGWGRLLLRFIWIGVK